MTDPFLEYLQEPGPRRLSRFIVAYTEPVTRLVRRVVSCPETARDVVQEVFLRLATPEQRAENVAHPRAYVLRTALNTARNYLREASVRAHHEHEAGRQKPRTSPSTEEEVAVREALERLYRAIDALPEPLRIAIHLRAVDGLSYKEVALVTGVSVGSVGARIREARERLGRLLGGHQMVVAWANLELAREQGWFPAATEGLSRTALARLEALPKSARATIVPAALVTIVAVAALGASILWMFERSSPEGTKRIEAAAARPGRRNVQVEPVAPSIASAGRNEKPMAPVVVGAETETREAGGDEPWHERPGESPAREREGGEMVTGKSTLLASAVVAVGMAAAVAAETGDVDGDGRLTIADIAHLEDRLEPAEGSITAFEEYPCLSEHDFSQDPGSYMPATIYFESLHRGVEGSLPPWDTVWPESIPSEPLVEDARCEIELLSGAAPGGANDRARLSFRVVVHAPVRSFSVVLEVPPGLLEAPPGGFDGHGPWYTNRRWRNKYEALGGGTHIHRFGDLPVGVTVHGYLVTGGRYVITYDLLDNEVYEDLQPGEYLVTIEARLALHTPAGTYPVSVHPASEVLFRDGTVRRPVVTAGSELTIENDVTVGLDDGVPPLEVDPENKEVLGRIEFRLVDENGHTAKPGEPIAEPFNDEVVQLRLQLRTEVPLNELHYALHWRTQGGLDIECVERRPGVLFVRPDGVPYGHFTDRDGNAGQGNECGSRLGNGRVQGIFRLAGSRNGDVDHNRQDRPLEYFRPLDTWIDLVEFRLQIPDEAVGGLEIPFRFDAGPATHEQKEKAAFVPYGSAYPCPGDLWPPEDPTHWKYHVIYHDTFIRVVGDDQEPPPPPDLGIRIALGAASGAPGDLVELPIQATADVELGRLRIALELDPTILSVEGVELDVIDMRTRSIVKRRIGRPGTLLYSVCTDEDGDGVKEFCTQGYPTVAQFRRTDDAYILLDLLPSSSGVDGHFVEIGRFLLRIAEDAAPGETVIAPGAVALVENNFELLIESGGNVEDQGLYSPASEVVPGTVIIVDSSRDLVRGDANVDGAINISDAALMLGALFTASAEVVCEDAADADDSGALNITDPILLLGVLFGGQEALPAPSTCAPDPTADALGCEEGCG